jgi:hypothetical protein
LHILQASCTHLITLNLYAAIVGSVSADNHFGSWCSCWACVCHNNNNNNNNNNNRHNNKNNNKLSQQQHSNTQTAKHTNKQTTTDNNNTLKLLGSH